METIRSENRESLLADKVEKLYDHAGLGLIATITNSCILVLALWGQIIRLLLSWLFAVAILCILRLILYVAYSKNSKHSGKITRNGPTVYEDLIFENRYEPILDETGNIVGAIGVAIESLSKQLVKKPHPSCRILLFWPVGVWPRQSC